MTDTSTPIEASTSGKNAFTLACPAIEQRMSYAACLNRLHAIESDAKVPKDWESCRSACSARQCPAQHMREDEKTAGKSLFFVAREAIVNASDSARKWIATWNKPANVKKAVGARSSGKSMFDAMGELGSMAEAISGISTPATPTPKPVAPAVAARPGETPLQMARRLAAERNKT
jgi:hypothetical protein